MSYPTGSIPMGRNTLPSRAIFYERQNYHRLYPDLGNDINLHENHLHGRVNLNANAVFPSEAFLSMVPKVKNVFALNFVVDAFVDLRRYVQEAYDKKRITQKGSKILSMVAPKRGWTSIHPPLDEHLNRIFDAFSSVYLRSKGKRAMTFDSFMEQFEIFVTRYPGFIISRSGFILSNLFDIRSSGLVIDMMGNGFSNDVTKHGWLQDPNWIFFVKAARSFGFRTDRNAPWRLVADIQHPAMQKKMATFGLTVDNVFDRVYYQACLSDLDVLRIYLQQFWLSYQRNKPYETDERIRIDGSVCRELLRREGRLEEKEERFWIRILLIVRAAEKGIVLPSSVINREVNKIKIFIDQFGEPQGLIYLNGFIKCLG
jgi:hypothetical protein